MRTPSHTGGLLLTLFRLRTDPEHEFSLTPPNQVSQAGAAEVILEREIQASSPVEEAQHTVEKGSPEHTQETKTPQTSPPLSGIPFSFSVEQPKSVAAPTRVEEMQSQKASPLSDNTLVARQLRDLQLSEQVTICQHLYVFLVSQ